MRTHGVSRAFCVPGESFLGTLAEFSLPDAPQLISSRHEEGAGLMAEAHAKASGEVGVVLVTRGPGLTHLSIALHTASQDSTSLVAIVGQVPQQVRYREAFQELDIVAFGDACGARWSAEIPGPDRAAELVDRAFRIAGSGRPGPVVIGIPENIDRDFTSVAPPRHSRLFGPVVAPAGADAAAELIGKAESVCLLAGSGILRAGATAQLVELAERLHAPVYTAWRRFDSFPNDHPLYLGGCSGMPMELYAPLREAEVVVAIGTRLSDFTSLGYKVPSPSQTLIHIDESAEIAGTQWPGADVALVGDCGSGLAALIERLQPVVDDAQVLRLRSWRKRFERVTTPRPHRNTDTEDDTSDWKRGTGATRAAVDLEGIYHDIRRILPPSACTTADAGTFGGWLMRFYSWREPGTQFAPTAGGMGYALPAAIGVKLARPEAPVVAFAGDGGFAMTMSELETAVRLRLGGLVVLVFDNELYGTIRRHQLRVYPDAIVGTALGPVAFADVAVATGALGWTIRSNDEFADVFSEALRAPVPAVIHIPVASGELNPWQDVDLASDATGVSAGDEV
jgi:acetolactate synthase-1/2/3 large subunit